MPASIWLQPSGEQQSKLRRLIAGLAAANSTVPFAPHLTVCGAEGIDADAAADYVRRCGLLPFRLRKAGISCSTTKPFKAVVIEIENTPELAAFRDTLRRMAGAPEFEPPHISLLYTIDAQRQPVGWGGDANRLEAIAADCASRVNETEFLLGDPVLVAPEGNWTNIESWRVLRKL